MEDEELILRAIQVNLTLIKSINRNPWMEGIVARKVDLMRGIEVLSNKQELIPLERSNLERFIEQWG